METMSSKLSTTINLWENWAIRQVLHLGLITPILLSIPGCQSDEFQPAYQVPEDIQVHVDSFLEEAAARGHEIGINNLIIEIDSDLGVGTCGRCNSLQSNEKVQKIIRLNPSCTNLGTTLLETLVYHELCHCVLNRPHDDRVLPNGDPRSLMVPGNIYIYSPCLYVICGEGCDQTFKRQYYMDELFDESTPVPAWAE